MGAIVVAPPPLGRNHDRLRPVAGVGQDPAPGIDDHRTAAQVHPPHFTPAVAGDDKGLVLDRPDLEYRPPVLDPRLRPLRRTEQQIGALLALPPRQVRKAQVVADQATEPPQRRRYRVGFDAADKGLVLAAEGEHLLFAVTAQDTGGAADIQRIVEQIAVIRLRPFRQ